MLANRGRGKKSRGKHSKVTRRSHVSHRLRGNPDNTRRAAKQELLNKLPDLAALAGIDPSTDPDLQGVTLPTNYEQPIIADDSITFAAITNSTKPKDIQPQQQQPQQESVTGGPVAIKGYTDSEIEEAESPEVAAENEKAEQLDDLPDADAASFRSEFSKYMASLNPEAAAKALVTENGIDKQTMMEALMNWLGTRYRFGGVCRSGIDCSAFTGMMYRSQGLQLPRTAAAQWDAGGKIDPNELQFGDLVFFHTRNAVYVSHVGMYLGNGMFAHASSRNGVTVSALGASYYSTHFIGARRFDFNKVQVAAAQVQEGQN